MITRTEIQKRLGEAIRESGIPQKSIALALNVSQSAVSLYANGCMMPSVKTFAKLCKIIGANTNYILCLKNDK